MSTPMKKPDFSSWKIRYEDWRCLINVVRSIITYQGMTAKAPTLKMVSEVRAGFQIPKPWPDLYHVCSSNLTLYVPIVIEIVCMLVHTCSPSLLEADASWSLESIKLRTAWQLSKTTSQPKHINTPKQF
jgi:hypothetical protein